MDAELLELEKFLAESDEKEKLENSGKNAPTIENAVPRLREDSSFTDAFSYEVELPAAKVCEAAEKAASKQDELDSSDDEEVKNFLERKYNEYGCGINKSLKDKRAAQHEEKIGREVDAAVSASAKSGQTTSFISDCHIKNPNNPAKRHSLVSTSFQKAVAPQARNIPAAIATPTPPPSSTFTDPVFGLRLINPLVSSALLVERMAGRKAVPFAGVAHHTERGDLAKDWVIAGALVNKSPVRMSKKGTPFSVWRLSDLRGDFKMVSVFLFQGAHKDLWKTAQGMCVALLNPSIFEKRAESGDVACLSIDTAQKVMILGQSKDLGVCKARKRNGEPCTSTVNLSECDFCIFHMKQEYGKMSRRPELQSANAGRGLNDLRNKVLGKSEVFYGGQSFSAVPAKKSFKLVAKDTSRMSALSEYGISPFASAVNHASKPRTENAKIPYAAREGPISKVACNVEASVKQRNKDLERLKILQAQTAAFENAKKVEEKTKIAESLKSADLPVVSPNANVASPTASAVPDKFKNREFSFSAQSPKLSSENFTIELNMGERQAQYAKLKAAQILKKQPIKKANPNSTRGTPIGKRRAIDELNDKFNSGAKRQKIEEDQREVDRKTRIQRIMDASSSHTNLIDMREQQEQDKYFNKLEKKEALEEKMLNTYKMPCKAVICKLCKYTAFSAADRCKEERHPLKVVDAEKRFFQCKDCGNRTTTVFKLPKVSCGNCKGSHWQRTAMIRERKLCNVGDGLSVRGDEETFMGSLGATANLNLLVPDE